MSERWFQGLRISRLLGLLSLWLGLAVSLQAMPAHQDTATYFFRLALERHDYRVAEQWMLRGADPRGVFYSSRRTALHLAAAAGESGLLELILRSPIGGGGVNRNARDETGQTPLHLAVRAGSLDCVRWLLYRGADASLQDTNGDTPLGLAISARKIAIVRHLLAYNPNVTTTDGRGSSAQDLAEGDAEVLALLSRHMELGIVAELAAWVLLAFTFWLPRQLRSIRSRPKLLRAVWLILLAHHGVALANSYAFPFQVYKSGDAYTYHRLARMGELAFNAEGGIYVEYLGYVYDLLGPSLLLGQELSILAHLLAVLLMVACARLLGMCEHLPGLIVLAGGLPGVVVFTSLTFVEAWLMLGLMLSVYGLLTEPLGLFPALSLTMGCLLLGVLHKATALLVPALLVIGVCFSVVARRKGSAWLLPALAAVVLVAPFTRETVSRVPYLLYQRNQAVSQGMHSEASANYGARLDFESLTTLVPGAIRELGMYMFAPFPWQIREPRDFYAFAESLLRAILLGFALGGCVKGPAEFRRQRWLVFLVWVTLEVLWAAGTINWGTALRHHLVAHPLLVLLGGGAVARALKRFGMPLVEGEKSDKA